MRRRVAGLTLLIISLVFGGRTCSAADASSILFTTCLAPWPALPGDRGDFGTADRLFRAGHDHDATEVLYQVLFCGPVTELDPRVSDAGLEEPLRRAIVLGFAGDYTKAYGRLRVLKSQLPELTEAGYIGGIFAWAAGDRTTAKRIWQETLSGPQFAYPFDGPDQSRAQIASTLRWAQNR